MLHILSSLSWSLFRVGSLSTGSEETSDEVDEHDMPSERSCKEVDLDIVIFDDRIRERRAWQTRIATLNVNNINFAQCFLLRNLITTQNTSYYRTTKCHAIAISNRDNHRELFESPSTVWSSTEAGDLVVFNGELVVISDLLSHRYVSLRVDYNLLKCTKVDHLGIAVGLQCGQYNSTSYMKVQVFHNYTDNPNLADYQGLHRYIYIL